MTTAISSYAKPDTVLLLDMLATDPWIDLSQHRTDLADNTTYVSESSSARTALGAPREIAIVVTVESGQEGILAQLGDAGGYSWRVRISADMVEVAENSILRASVELPSASKSAQAYLIHWSIHEDGVGGVRHELAVCNLDTEEWDHAQATTGAGTMDATDTLTIGAGYSGASPFDGGLAAIGKVRIGRRHHSGCEAAEDWLGLTTPPAMTQVRRGAPAAGPHLLPDRLQEPPVRDGRMDMVVPGVPPRRADAAVRRDDHPALAVERDPEGGVELGGGDAGGPQHGRGLQRLGAERDRAGADRGDEGVGPHVDADLLEVAGGPVGQRGRAARCPAR